MALMALQLAYAGPMPIGIDVDAECDKATLKAKEVDSAGVETAVLRIPALAAAEQACADRRAHRRAPLGATASRHGSLVNPG
jgi:hypothetical protein